MNEESEERIEAKKRSEKLVLAIFSFEKFKNKNQKILKCHGDSNQNCYCNWIHKKRGFYPSMLDRLSIVFNIAVQVASVSFLDIF